MNLSTATTEQLLEAERIAIKYTPSFALMIAKTYYRRLVKSIIIGGGDRENQLDASTKRRYH